jgi:hypothetical protein
MAQHPKNYSSLVHRQQRREFLEALAVPVGLVLLFLVTAVLLAFAAAASELRPSERAGYQVVILKIQSQSFQMAEPPLIDESQFFAELRPLKERVELLPKGLKAEIVAARRSTL